MMLAICLSCLGSKEPEEEDHSEEETRVPPDQTPDETIITNQRGKTALFLKSQRRLHLESQRQYGQASSHNNRNERQPLLSSKQSNNSREDGSQEQRASDADVEELLEERDKAITNVSGLLVPIHELFRTLGSLPAVEAEGWRITMPSVAPKGDIERPIRAVRATNVEGRA